MSSNARNSILIFLSLLLFGSRHLHAQIPMEWDDFTREIYEEYIESNDELVENADETSSEEDGISDVLLNELYTLHLSPINLNDLRVVKDAEEQMINAKERLRQLPFLSERQIEAIVYYVNNNYPMQSLGELMLIREIDYVTRSRLTLFCYVGEPTVKNDNKSIWKLLRYANHEVIVRTDIPFYTKEGYLDKPKSVIDASPNKIYQGNNNYHSLRYQLRSMQQKQASGINRQIIAGCSMEKDAGEEPYDYLSGYVMMKGLGRIHSFIIGDFKLNYGLGLTVNNSINLGKNTTGVLSNAPLSGRGIRPHASTSESNHFRGIAINYSLSKSTHFTAFVSYQDIDATRNQNASTSSVTSLKTDGLHRTLLEKSKKGIIQELSGGGNLCYYHRGLLIELTGIATHFSMPLYPKYNTPSTLYRQFNLQGDNLGAIGLSYQYRTKRWNLQGEYAFSFTNGTDSINNVEKPNNGFACINNVRYHVDNYTSLSALVRYYDAKYATRYGHSFGENSRPQNEVGFLVGITTEPWTHIHVEAYIDCFKFIERSYHAAAGAKGIDGQIKMAYTPSERTTWQLRYRVKSKEQDCKIGNDQTDLFYSTRHDLRLQWNYKLNNHLTTRTIGSFIYRWNADSNNEAGYLLSQHIRHEQMVNHQRGRQRIDFMFTYFHTDSYATKVYTTTPSLLYTLGMNALYGHGINAIALFSRSLSSKISAICKFSITKYFDRSSIGTGLELIHSSHREDVQLQLRWKI